MATILALNGSPRAGATEYALKTALAALDGLEDINIEYMSLKGKKIQPCNGCGYCKKNKTWCILKDDFQELIDRFIQADAYLIGTPVYVYAATPQLAAFCSRMRPLFHIFPEAVRNKPVAALAVGGARNGGEEAAVAQISNMFMARGMNIVSNEIYGYAGAFVWSKDQGAEGAEADELGMSNVLKLARKLAEVARIMEYGNKAISAKKI